jgi:hypothetical protein
MRLMTDHRARAKRGSAQCASSSKGLRRPRFIARSIPMMDIILIAVALGLFAVSVGYTVACDRL